MREKRKKVKWSKCDQTRMMESEADLRRNSCDPLFWVVIDQKTAPVLTGHGEPESQEQAHSPVSFV